MQRIPTGPLDANCYVLSGSPGEAVLIDAGDDPERIEAHLRDRSLRLLAVIATHGHHDHLAAAAELCSKHRAPFCLHPADAGLLPRMNFYRRMLHSAESRPTPTIDLLLEGGAVLDLAGLEIEILHSPGHTPGGLCCAVEGELFTGDTLLAGGLGRSDLPGGDAKALQRSVHALVERFPPETQAHPGHGAPAPLGDLIRAAELVA